MVGMNVIFRVLGLPAVVPEIPETEMVEQPRRP